MYILLINCLHDFTTKFTDTEESPSQLTHGALRESCVYILGLRNMSFQHEHLKQVQILFN